jgi:TnpA family transposase
LPGRSPPAGRDTHGVTLVNFGLFDLLALQLSPRIRDLGKITLYRTGPKSQVESAFPLAGQAWCLSLVTNAVVTWTTEYYGLAVESMRRSGRRIDDDVLAHTSPAHSENINFFGSVDVDIEGELAQLGPTGYRPLRVRDTLF